MFNNLSTALIDLLEDLPKIQKFYDYEATMLEGFPALTLTASGNESAYSTTTENRRVYPFVIRLYVERGSTPEAESQAELTMRDMVDSVLDRLDKNHYLQNSQLTLPQGYTFLFMGAAPSRWGYAGRENQMRFAEVTVQLHVDVDVNLIS